MDTLRAWLEGLSGAARILDLGCGAGSFGATACGAATLFGVDSDFRPLRRARGLLCASADAALLPFNAAVFDLVLCHHSLEHFGNVERVLSEIRRVLKPDGKLFVSVPEGASFSDRLYRVLLTGGGHLQSFTFGGIVALVESHTSLRLAAWKPLYSSFNYVDKLNFVPCPRGRLPGPFPRRMRWMGRAPGACFVLARLALNVATRIIDRLLNTRLSGYGWAMAFAPGARAVIREPCSWNVCMRCGHALAPGQVPGRLIYTCPACGSRNPNFGRANPSAIRSVPK